MKIQTKIGICMIPVIMLAMGTLSWWTISTSTQHLYSLTLDKAQIKHENYYNNTLNHLYRTLEDNKLENEPSFVQEFQDKAFEQAWENITPGRSGITILNKAGELIFSTWPEDRRTQLIDAWKNSRSHAKSPARTLLGNDMEPISVSREFPPWEWQVIFSKSTEDLHNLNRSIVQGTVLLTALTLIVSLTVSYLIFKIFFLHPVKKLQEFAATITANQTVSKIDIHTQDEMGQLARDLETMACAIHEYKRKQADWGHQLEIKVQEKTIRLVEARKKEAQQRQRIESLWQIAQMEKETVKEICDYALQAVQEMTQSQYAFLGFINPNQTEMNLHSWSLDAMSDCAMDEKPMVFSIPKGGLWAEAVRKKESVMVNDYAQHCAGGSGIPKGHVVIKRTLTVPVLSKGRVEMIACVANKNNGYTLEDQEQVRAFLGNVSILIHQKQAQAEKELLFNQVVVLQKNEAIGTLAGGIAHDFNNILFPILGNAELLLEDLEEGSDLSENAREIYNAAKRAKNLINQILTFARQGDEHLISVSPGQVIQEVINLVSATLPKTIRIRQDLSDDCRRVMADPTKLHQVVMNLVTNAYHAMEKEGGLLSVLLKNIDFHQMPEGLGTDSGPHILLSITDTGTGMSRQTLDQAFDPYFTTKPKGKGTGLGLSVVNGIVKKMGGGIQIESGENQGTCVTIFLPATSDTKRHKDQNRSPALPTGTESILVVDDEDNILRMNEKLLGRLGYTAETCGSGEEALRRIRQTPEKYDLVITDMSMPGMTGDRLAQEIKMINPALPVILNTGFSDRISEERATDIGIRALMYKPITKADMAITLRNVLDATNKEQRTCNA